MTIRNRGTGSFDQVGDRVRGRIRIKGRPDIVVYGEARADESGRAITAREDAEELLRAARELVTSGAVSLQDDKSVRSYCDLLMKRKQQKGVRGLASVEDRMNYIRRAPWIHWPVGSVKTAHTDDLIAEIAKTQVKRGHEVQTISPRTVNAILGLLREVFGEAVRREALLRNPAEFTDPLPTDEERVVFYTPAQQRLIAESSLADFDKLPVLFAKGTGVREGEQGTLHLPDLRANDANPHCIVRYGSREKGILKSPKGRRTRVVQLVGPSLDAAQRWLRILPEWCPSNPHGLVFPRRNGGFRDANHFLGRVKVYDAKLEKVVSLDRWAILQKEIGIPVYNWHALRHTCATSLGAGWWGVVWTLEQIAQLLGHSDKETTRLYRHIIEEALNEIAAKTTGLLASTSVHGQSAIPKALGPSDLSGNLNTGCSPAPPSNPLIFRPSEGSAWTLPDTRERSASITARIAGREGVSIRDALAFAAECETAFHAALAEHPVLKAIAGVRAGGPAAERHLQDLTALVDRDAGEQLKLQEKNAAPVAKTGGGS